MFYKHHSSFQLLFCRIKYLEMKRVQALLYSMKFKKKKNCFIGKLVVDFKRIMPIFW